MLAEDKKRAKKKCKTQGEESMEKLLTEGPIPEPKSKWKKEKENSTQAKLTSELSKTSLLKGESALSSLKMKRIAEKLSELTNKYPGDKKKTRLKTQKE